MHLYLFIKKIIQDNEFKNNEIQTQHPNALVHRPEQATQALKGWPPIKYQIYKCPE